MCAETAVIANGLMQSIESGCTSVYNRLALFSAYIHASLSQSLCGYTRPALRSAATITVVTTHHWDLKPYF
jgi:hypothetical protein